MSKDLGFRCARRTCVVDLGVNVLLLSVLVGRAPVLLLIVAAGSVVGHRDVFGRCCPQPVARRTATVRSCLM